MKNLLLVLCLVVFCLQAEAALSATDQNLEAAIAYGKSYQGEKNDAVMLQPWVIAESFETNPYRDEERIIVYTPYLLTALDTAGKTQEAAGISVENAKELVARYDGVLVIRRRSASCSIIFILIRQNSMLTNLIYWSLRTLIAADENLPWILRY